MSDEIDKWARKYAQVIATDETLCYVFGVYVDENMSMARVEKNLMSRPDFQRLHAALNCPLEGAEFRFMLAAIPHWLDVLEREPVEEPELTTEQKVYAAIDRNPLAKKAVRRLVQAAVPKIKKVTAQVRKYNERGE